MTCQNFLFRSEADTSLSYSHCSFQWIVFVAISCKNRLINKKHRSNFPKYLSPRPSTETWYCSNRVQDKPELRRPGLLLLHVAVTLASVFFRFEVSWVLTLPLTQLPLTQVTLLSSVPSLQHLYCLEGCNYPVGVLTRTLQHKETFSLISFHFVLWPSLRSILESLPWPFKVCTLYMHICGN